jgi:hypothetical protein
MPTQIPESVIIDGQRYVKATREVKRKVDNSEDRRQLKQDIHDLPSLNKTRFGEVYKRTYRDDGSVDQDCDDYQKFNEKNGRCNLQRSFSKTGKVLPLDDDVQDKRNRLYEDHLTGRHSKKDRIADMIRSMTSKPGYTPKDKWGHTMNSDASIPCDEDQVWDPKKKHCAVDKTKSCRDTPCPPGTFPPGTRRAGRPAGNPAGAGHMQAHAKPNTRGSKRR